MNNGKWRERIERRSDITSKLVHLTSNNDSLQAFDVLKKILQEKKLNGSGKEGYINGCDKCVCFQDVPILNIAENVRYEFEKNSIDGTYKRKERKFGIRVDKELVYKRGGRPVIYGDREELKEILDPSMYWRIVSMNLETENMIDWSFEREWRVKDSFEFEYSDVEVILPGYDKYKEFVAYCINENIELLKQIKGIVILESVIS